MPNIASVPQKVRGGAPAEADSLLESPVSQLLQHRNNAILSVVARKDAASLQSEGLPIVPRAGSQMHLPEYRSQFPGLRIGSGRHLCNV